MSATAIYNPDRQGSELGGARRLGWDLAPPRNLYVLYLPLLMVSSALLCWILPTDPMLAFGSVMLAAVSVFVLFEMLFRGAPLRISTILMFTLGLGYGLGAANTYFSLQRDGVSLGEMMHRDPIILTHTMGSILFSMAVLLSAGELFEKPLFGRDFRLNFPPQAVLFISLGVLMLLVAYAVGALNYMGATHAANGELGVFASFAQWLIGTLFAITLVATLNVRGKTLRRYLILLTALQFLLEIPVGRRSLIYTVLLALLVLPLGRFRFQWTWPRRIVLAVLISGLIYVSSIGFFYLRLASYSTRTPLGIVDRVVLAYNFYLTKDYAEVSKSLSQNVETRTFILGFLADLESYSSRFTPGYGTDLMQQVTAAIPSVLYPSKNRDLNEEGLANKLFGSAYLDEANSVLTAGVTDFGLLGMIVYPLMVSLALRWLLEVIGETLPTFVAVFIITGTIGRILQPENTLTDFVVIIRNGLLFGVVIWFFLALPAFKFRRDA